MIDINYDSIAFVGSFAFGSFCDRCLRGFVVHAFLDEVLGTYVASSVLVASVVSVVSAVKILCVA